MLHTSSQYICANFSFALGSVAYTRYSRILGDLWMNKFKAFVALIGFSLVLIISGETEIPKNSTVLYLIISGMLGLGIGDTFLLKSFMTIGSGRTLVLFGFQPIILGSLGYFILGQSLGEGKFIGIKGSGNTKIELEVGLRIGNDVPCRCEECREHGLHAQCVEINRRALDLQALATTS